MKEKKNKLGKRVPVILATLALCLVVCGFFCDDAIAYTVNEVHLQDGQTYDITNAPKNTIVYIDDKTASRNSTGQVTLKGSSEKVWVSISLSKGKTVIVDLADGLTITPKADSAYGTGSNSDTLGWSRSAIYIDETKYAGGVVVLRSKRGATIRLDSWQCGIWQSLPAIMKNDTKTKLIFDTEDKSDPGTIIAKPTSGEATSGTCGIGAYGHGAFSVASSSYTVGNIDFAGGNIEAYGLTDGPGIGAYAYSNIGTIEFSGAHVVAEAGNSGATQFSECGGAGIGTGYHGRFEKISISGGYVEAWGRGSNYDDKKYPLLSRVSVGGCGIGSGCGEGKSGMIEISGGTVKAHGGTCSMVDGSKVSGCGIGSVVHVAEPSSESSVESILITGGDVTAVGGWFACGIGGTVKDITIAPKDEKTELKIDASIDSRKDRGGYLKQYGAGIGIANNVLDATFDEYPGNITIKGGDITATAGSDVRAPLGAVIGGAGIGTTDYGRVNSINISGGRINAYGGWNSPGIGGPNHYGGTYHYDHTVGSINISGGTITATKATHNWWDDAKLSAIGGYKYRDEERTDITITGGSIIADGDDYAIGYDTAGQPKNDRDEIVYGTKFIYDPDCDEWTKVKDFTTDPMLRYNYGMNDVYIKKGLDDESETVITEFWLPKDGASDGYLSKVYTAGRRYGSFDTSQDPSPEVRVNPDTKSTLTAFTNITYNSRKSGYPFTASGTGVYGNKKLIIDPIPIGRDPQLYELYGYNDGSGKKVANGRFKNGSSEDGIPELIQSTEYVDSDAKWNAKYEELMLELMLDQIRYRVDYDKNQPFIASHDVTGNQMEDVFDIYDHSQLKENNLRSNTYSLVGWEFTGWNTKPDGTGDSYSDGGKITFDTSWGAKLTLYAQWKPKTYTITFKSSDEAGASTYTQQAEYDTYDKFDTISKIGWSKNGYSFHGWSTNAFGSFYEDGEDFCNFCTMDDNGNLTGKILTAEWVGSGKIKVTVTVDGEPKDVTDTMYIQKVNGTDTERVNLTDNGNGRYEADLSTIPEGEYQLLMDSDTYVIPQDKQGLGSLTQSSAVSIVLDYYTVTMNKDDHISSAYVKENGTSNPNDSMEVADGTQVVIGASADPGYHFDGYSYYGVEPEWSQGPSVNEQGITVQGKVDITAHAEANVYHVKYARNKPANASHDVEGNMENQDFVYDEPQDLRGSEYMLTGWTFKGWNKEADGSGTPYTDEQNVSNLTTGDSITLYAQWEQKEYLAYFSATDATSGAMEPQVLKYDDPPTSLTENAFERTDWHFMGWNTEPGGGGIAFADKEEVSNLTTGRSITLYAQWEHDYYTVKFDKNDDTATGEMPDEHIWTNCGYELPLCSFIKTGYHLDAWTTEPDGSGEKYKNGEAVKDLAPKDGSITLYAQWKPNEYTVKYDANGGKGKMENQSFVYDIAQNLLRNGFRREHYVFNGWNTMPDGQGKSFKDQENVINLTAAPNHEVTLYAQWNRIKHNITYDLNGGTLDEKTGKIVVEANEGDTITVMKAPTRKGYTFQYWKGSKYNPGDDYLVKEDHTLTAEWKKNENPNPDDPDNPKDNGGTNTGDESHILLWIALMTLSMLGLTITALTRRRHN